MKRRAFSVPCLLLVLTLVWAQLAGAVHGLSHGIAGMASVQQLAESGQEQGGAAGHLCLDCLAYSTLDAPLRATPPMPVLERQGVISSTHHPAGRLVEAPSFFRSRAPPSFS